MKRWKLGAIASGLALIGLAFANPAESPFEGSWSGTYSLPDFGGGGTAEFTISNSGVLNGRSVNDDGTGHTLIAHIKPDGSTAGVAIFDDPGNPAEFFSGTCSIVGNGNLFADLTGCIQNDCFTLLVTVAPD